MQLEYIYKMLLDILTTPSLALAVIAAVGLIVLKKRAAEVFTGFMKVFIAVIMVGSAAGVIVVALLPMNSLFELAFGFRGIYALGEIYTAAAMPILGFEISAILGLGFLIHLVIVRFVPKGSFKQVFLTGHVMWTEAGLTAIVLNNYGFRGTDAILLGGLIQGIYLTVSNALTWWCMKPTTDGRFGLGHIISIPTAASAIVAKYLGNPKNDAEKVKFPESLSFLRLPSVVAALIMASVFIILSVGAGSSVVEARFSGGVNFIAWSLITGVTFGAGVELILAGVRMFIGEILPAFKGISEKVIPGAIPALDMPAMFSLAPTALMVGVAIHVPLLVGFSLLQVVLGFPTIMLPNAIVAFFDGAVVGIVGNKLGGLRGIVLGSVVNCLYYSFMGVFGTPFMGLEKLGFAGMGALADDATWAVIIAGICTLLGRRP